MDETFHNTGNILLTTLPTYSLDGHVAFRPNYYWNIVWNNLIHYGTHKRVAGQITELFRFLLIQIHSETKSEVAGMEHIFAQPQRTEDRPQRTTLQCQIVMLSMKPHCTHVSFTWSGVMIVETTKVIATELARPFLN